MPSPLTLERSSTCLPVLCPSPTNSSWDRWKTGFITPSGHYVSQVILHGLSNSPSVFQGFMNEVFKELFDQFIIVYTDNILIYFRTSPPRQAGPGKTPETPPLPEAPEVWVPHGASGTSSALMASKWTRGSSRLSVTGLTCSRLKNSNDSSNSPTSIPDLFRTSASSPLRTHFSMEISHFHAPPEAQVPLPWNPEAQAAFQKLQEAFSTAPIFTHPDPQLPFVVEVDASTTGVGAVLSQHPGQPPHHHPCAFFTMKLSPAERNYDIGNRELLAIKLALEEWWHWLEGAQHPSP